MTAIKADEPSREALLALADEIENSDGLIRILKTAGTIQLGIEKTAQIVAALRAPAGNDGAVREALKPFAKWADDFEAVYGKNNSDDILVAADGDTTINLGNLRQARASIALPQRDGGK